MTTPWLWDTRLTEKKVRSILKNENNPRYFIYAEKLFSRVTNLEEAFSFVSKKAFRKHWPVIKQRVNKDAWSKSKTDYWQKYYEQIVDQTKAHDNTMTARMAIAQRIKELRLESGYTQVELAQRMGVIQQFISKVESGRENLTIDTLKRIADVFEKKLTIRLG